MHRPLTNGSFVYELLDRASKVGLPPTHPGSPLSFGMYPNEPFGPQPPPAHMGIPPVHIDPKTGFNDMISSDLLVILIRCVFHAQVFRGLRCTPYHHPASIHIPCLRRNLLSGN
uniref:Uncharacterized protein n=1 Tax=Strigamia maritima TaxID=126957 RepID=T1JD02_STRMM